MIHSVEAGVCSVIVLGASPGQISVIQASTAAAADVIIQTFGATDVGMLMQLAFFICREHPFLFLVYRADIQVGGLASGRSGVFNMQKIVHWPSHMF